MAFAPDTELALTTTAALVNSDRPGADELATAGDLDAFCERYKFSGVLAHDAAELRAVRALRPVLRGLWEPDADAVAERVNAVLAEHRALPQLVRHDGWDWHLHAISPSAPLASRMAVEAAMAWVDVIRSGELDRLRHCADPDCDGVLVDLSRNRSRRFCERGCGNRANVRAYRARRADVAQDESRA